MTFLRWLAPVLLIPGLVACGSSARPQGPGGGGAGGHGSTGTLTGGAGGSGDGGSGGAPSPPQCSDPSAPAIVPGTPDPGAWYVRIGGPDDQESMAIAADGEGGVVVTGHSVGPADFGAGEEPAVSAHDFFVARYDAAGALVWVRRFGEPGVEPTDVAVDGHDDIVVIGTYTGGSPSFDGLALPAAQDADLFVVELSPDGATRWAHGIGGPGYDAAGKVAVGPDDRVVVAGTDGTSHLRLSAFSAHGDVLFQQTLGSLWGDSEFAPIDALQVDAHGDIYLASTPANGDLGPGSSSQGGLEASGYVAKHAGADGARLWAQSFDGGHVEGSEGAALVVVGDDVVVSSPSAGATDVGGGAFGAACSGVGGFVARLSGADGGYRWSRSFAETVSFRRQLSLDGAGRVVLVSNQGGTSDLGGGPASFDGTFVSVYDAGTGAFVSIRPLVEVGTISADTMDGSWGLGSTALDGKGHIFVETTFFDTVSYGGGSMTSEGWGDVLLMRVAL